MNAETGTWGVFRGDLPERRWYHWKLNPPLVRRTEAQRREAGEDAARGRPGTGGGESGQLFLRTGGLRGDPRGSLESFDAVVWEWSPKTRGSSPSRGQGAIQVLQTALPDCRDDNLEEEGGSVTPVLFPWCEMHPNSPPGALRRKALLGDLLTVADRRILARPLSRTDVLRTCSGSVFPKRIKPFY